MFLTRRAAGPVAVALLALLTLGYASVRSTVMQAVGMPSSSAARICGEPGMNGMSMSGMSNVVTSYAQGETALIVEDDATVRLILAEVLAELGYDVIAAF